MGDSLARIMILPVLLIFILIHQHQWLLTLTPSVGVPFLRDGPIAEPPDSDSGSGSGSGSRPAPPEGLFTAVPYLHDD